MGTVELRGRENWQGAGGLRAVAAEKQFEAAFRLAFEGTIFAVRSKPREFRDIYSSVELEAAVLETIYQPGRTWVHGILPDYAIDNTENGKTLYIEVKRQDGWVEGKLPAAGRGNAHERSCKFFTPGLLALLRERGGLGSDVLPFWIVYQGDIARDPKRVREITFWFGQERDHFFMWQNSENPAPLIDHFDRYLKPLLL